VQAKDWAKAGVTDVQQCCHDRVLVCVQAVCCVGAGTVQGGRNHTINEYVQAAEGPRVGHLLPYAAHLAGVQYGFLMEFFYFL